MINGLVIQRETNSIYRGIEGDNWFFVNIEPKVFKEYIENNIEKSWYRDDWVDVCNDIKFIKMCVERLTTNGIKYRLILCETEKSNPRFDNTCLQKVFVGYDYAYAGGSYYSAVYNDIFSKRIPEFASIKLNKNGLFDSIENLNKYITMRKMCLNNYEKNMFEIGDFIIYKLYEIVG